MATIKRRGNSYLIRVSCGYDASGKQIVKSMTWKIPEGMSDKKAEKEVNRIAAEFENQCHFGQVSADPKMKFSEFIPTYLETVSADLSETTMDYYKRALDNYIIPFMGNMVMEEIRPLHIQKFISFMSKKPSRVHQRKDGSCPDETKVISPATVMRYLTVVRSVFRIAYKLEIVTTNPTDARRLEMPKVPEAKIEFFGQKDISEMFLMLDKEPLQTRLYIYLSFIVGSRRGELGGLKFSDFNYETKLLTIERTAYKLTGMPISTKPTKGNKVMYIQVNDFILELLDELKEEKERTKARLGDRWVGDEWLFTQWNGEIMNPCTMTRTFSKFLKKNDIRHRKLHAMRHSMATLMLASGFSIKDVQMRLGHGDIKTTNRYLHVLPEANAAATDRMTEILTGKKQEKEE